MHRFDVPAVGYTTPVASIMGVTGICSPWHPYDDSRRFSSADPAASLSVPPVLAARMGGPRACRFPQGVPGLQTRSSCRLQFAVDAVVFANRTPWRPLMAQSLSLPARTAARVIALPNAAPHPVLQRRGPGRRPPHIINLSRWKLDRKFSAKAKPVDAHASMEQARTFVQTCERLLQDARAQYMVAQQRAVVQRTSRNVRSSLNPTWSDR